LNDLKAYLQTLTKEQKRLFKRYENKERPDRLKVIDNNKEKYNEIRKEHIKSLKTVLNECDDKILCKSI
jgi:hypothetical protein